MTAPAGKADFEKEVTGGERFEFGKNWLRFLNHLSEKRIDEAENSLKSMLGLVDLRDQKFLDIGCGSGLFSLAAARMNAASVHSFDYDPQSTSCCMQLKERFFPGLESWTIEQASVLDEQYVENLGKFDVVYSWGVLHHTGKMWEAIENATRVVKPGGKFFIAIYNDQGLASRVWLSVKKLYNRLPAFLRFLVLYPAFLFLWSPIFLRDLFTGKPGARWNTYIKDRGMSPWDDVVDWVGGYPFEVASPGAIFSFVSERGFVLQKMKTTSNLGCNEYVFIKSVVNNKGLPV